MYLGDEEQLKHLLPSREAVIFVGDYKGNYKQLAEYLKYLTQNQTAYEEHRSGWRRGFDRAAHIRGRPLLRRSWPCRACKWALRLGSSSNSRKKHTCVNPSSGNAASMSSVGGNHSSRGDLNGKAVRGGGREVFLVLGGHLHLLPSLATLFALNLRLEDIVSLDDAELRQMPLGSPIHAK